MLLASCPGCLPTLATDCDPGDCPTGEVCVAGLCLDDVDAVNIDPDGGRPDAAQDFDVNDVNIRSDAAPDTDVNDVNIPSDAAPDTDVDAVNIGVDGAPDANVDAVNIHPDAAPSHECVLERVSRWEAEAPAAALAVAPTAGTPLVAWSDGGDTLRVHGPGFGDPVGFTRPGVRFESPMLSPAPDGTAWLGGVVRRLEPRPDETLMAIVTGPRDPDQWAVFHERGNPRTQLYDASALVGADGEVWVAAVQFVSAQERSVVGRHAPEGPAGAHQLSAVSQLGEVLAPPHLQRTGDDQVDVLTLLREERGTRLVRARLRVERDEAVGGGGDARIVLGRGFAHTVLEGTWFLLVDRDGETWLLAIRLPADIGGLPDAPLAESRVAFDAPTRVVAAPDGPLVVSRGAVQRIRDGRVVGDPLPLERQDVDVTVSRWSNGPLLGTALAGGQVALDRLDCGAVED